jgi:hypothetical protein
MASALGQGTGNVAAVKEGRHIRCHGESTGRALPADTKYQGTTCRSFEFIQIMFENQILPHRNTHVSIINNSWLMLFRGMIRIYCNKIYEIISIYLILLDALGPRFTRPLTKMSMRSRKIMFLGSRAQLVRRDGNLTAIYEPIV